MKYLVTILTLGFFLHGTALQGNVDSTEQVFLEQKTISPEVFDSLKQSVTFDQTKKVLRPRERKKKEKKEEEEIEFKPQPHSGGFSINGSLVQAIAYLLIAGLALTIIYLIFSGVKIKPKIDHSEIALSEIEDIEEVDTNSGYEQALQAGDYRLALRMQFIKVLQALSANNRINWKPDKTNRHYIRETRGLDIHHTFRSLSQTYEWVWYGNSAIGKETFDELNPQFESFHQSDTNA